MAGICLKQWLDDGWRSDLEETEGRGVGRAAATRTFLAQAKWMTNCKEEKERKGLVQIKEGKEEEDTSRQANLVSNRVVDEAMNEGVIVVLLQ